MTIVADMSCLTFQSVSLCNKFQEVYDKNYLSQKKCEKSDLSKVLYSYDNHKIGEWGVLKIFHVFADFIVFKR